MTSELSIPKAFITRRLHSITGLFLVLYLIEHLFVNSQAALFIGDNGKGFVHAVNAIHNLPYLKAIEILLLGVPILVHMWWGIQYLFTSEANSYGNTGAKPYLAHYYRNHAYTWQRITSWILIFGIIAHVIHMRFVEYPASAQVGTASSYMIRLNKDSGLETVAARLGAQLYDAEAIKRKKEEILSRNFGTSALGMQKQQEQKGWLAALESRPLRAGEVIAVADHFGTADLLMVRETFKMPIMLALYTIFVLSACFHAFNGLWTFMISWGITLTAASQKIMSRFAYALMMFIAFLGLAAIWGTYWINLKQ